MAKVGEPSPTSGAEWLKCDPVRNRLQLVLEPIRDRVLEGARLQAGQWVLDVGAGTGLLAFEARRRVGSTGVVVALDVSQDALSTCRQRADSEEPVAPLHFVVGEAAHLPFGASSFDAAVIRSVLQFVREKLLAACELFRVLRPGGRVSLYEPINRVGRGYAWNPDLDVPPIQAEHDRIVAYIHENWEYREPVLGFDERDLMRWFEEAGFHSIEVSSSYRYTAARRMKADRVKPHLEAGGHTHAATYAVAARAVLGAKAEEHLARMEDLLVSRPQVSRWAETYLVARKAAP